MFTGIVEAMGTVGSFDGTRLVIADAGAVLGDVTLGASIAVNGCCLTVVAWDEDSWTAELSDETLRRTSLSALEPGDPVNLERPVRLQDRLGGHLVQGHVDTVGKVVTPVPDMRVQMPAQDMRYVVEKGSVTVDGVSLTVVDALTDGFTAAVIPHTSQVTTLGTRGVGDAVNIELDVMAKYAERLLSGYLPVAGHEQEDDHES